MYFLLIPARSAEKELGSARGADQGCESVQGADEGRGSALSADESQRSARSADKVDVLFNLKSHFFMCIYRMERYLLPIK